MTDQNRTMQGQTVDEYRVSLHGEEKILRSLCDEGYSAGSRRCHGTQRYTWMGEKQKVTLKPCPPFPGASTIPIPRHRLHVKSSPALANVSRTSAPPTVASTCLSTATCSTDCGKSHQCLRLTSPISAPQPSRLPRKRWAKAQTRLSHFQVTPCGGSRYTEANTNSPGSHT